MWEEYELKLALLPEDIPRLSRNSLVRSLASQRAKTKHLHSTYFDTDAQDLRRQGMALRVRSIGNRWVQTLKTPGNGETGLQHNREYEAELKSGEPDLSRIEDDDLQILFAEQHLAEKLKPVFTTEFDRRSVPLRLGDSEVELALDEGEIKAGEERMPICEAELELVSGPPARIYELALALNEQVPLRLELRTKSARGYGLAAALSPDPVKAKPLKLGSKMSVAEVLAVVTRNCLDQIRGNEAAVFASVDPEGVHQFRVGVRRLRSMVTTFRDFLTPKAHGYLREELSWLQGTMGPPRDWDVFIEETLLPLRARLTSQPGLGEVIESARALRYQAYQQAKTTLFDPRYTALMLRLELWLDTGSWLTGIDGSAPRERIERLSCMLLDSRARKLQKSGGQREKLSEPELHCVRIHAKKMRYLTEFFESLYGKKAVQRHTTALRTLQDTLGALNDSVVGDELLLQLEERLSRGLEQPKLFTREALATVRGWQAACIERELANFDDAWTHYEAIKRYWN